MRQATKETAVITTTARMTAARLAIRAARPRRLTSTLLWAAQILLAALFVFFALLKLGGGLVQEFADIGVGQWLRYVSGTAELAGAIGLLTPWLAGLAAAGLATVMGGATIINATVLNSIPQWRGLWVLTLVLFVPCVLVAYGRRQQIKALAAAIRR
jgi:putative oxidoreductase